MTHKYGQKNEHNVKALEKYLNETHRKYFKVNKLVLQSTDLTTGQMIDAIRTLEQQGALIIDKDTSRKVYLVNYEMLGVMNVRKR
jgi:hypothetical protein